MPTAIRLVRRGALLYGARITYGALLLAASIIISHSFGAYGLGLYTLLLTITNLGSIVGTYGTNSLVIERYAVCADDPRARSRLLTDMVKTVLVAGVPATIASLGVAWWFVPDLWWAASTVLPIALSTLFLGYLVAQRRQLTAAMLESVLRPTIFIALLLVLGLGVRAGSAATIGWALTFSLVLLTIVTAYLYLPDARRGAASVASPGTGGRGLLPRSGAAYMTIALLTAAGAQLDRFVIQILSTTDQVGLYASAQNIMNIVSYAMLALMSLLLPAVADYYAKRMEESRFVSRAKLVARGLTLLAAVVLVISVFGGEFLLRAFGPGFQAAHSALVILSIGQLVGAALGVGTTVLSMGDHRHTAVWITGLTVVVNLGLAFALVGPFGLEGAAVANASGLVFNRLAGHLVSRRRLGLSLTAF